MKNADIPVVILCGGKGTRLGGHAASEVPKPLLNIGEKPILWHVMKIYAAQGFKRFILCVGHKGAQIKNYFKKNNQEHWHIQCVDTGLETPKAQRIAKVKRLIEEENFFLAYGDDVADIDLSKLFRLHLNSGSIATITAVQMISDFGVVEIGRNNAVTAFKEKPYLKKRMNGGFMVMNRKIFDFLNLGELENAVFKKLVTLGRISAYRHPGQWKTMNTLKDNLELNTLWKTGRAFWKTW